MLKINLYSAKGTKLEPITLPKVYEEEPNKILLAQAIRVLEDNAHFGVAKTKTRAEINKTKKKIYRQKGTGGARHGAKSAPIYVGGGVAHGRKLESRKLVLPKKMAQKALKIAISVKAKAGRLIAVKAVESLKKTKDSNIFVTKVRKDFNLKSQKISLVLSEKNKEVIKAFRNLPKVEILKIKDINAKTIYLGGLVIFDQEVFGVKKESEANKK